MNVEDMDREELLEELGNYRFVPGHGPDYNKKTDNELRILLEHFRRMFKEAFKKEED